MLRVCLGTIKSMSPKNKAKTSMSSVTSKREQIVVIRDRVCSVLMIGLLWWVSHIKVCCFFFFWVCFLLCKLKQNQSKRVLRTPKLTVNTNLNINWSRQVHHASLPPIYFPSQTLIAGLFSGIELTFWVSQFVSFYEFFYSTAELHLLSFSSLVVRA